MSFRIKAKRLFLTYSKCPKHWSKEFVKQSLVDGLLIYRRGEHKYKSKVKAYVIAEELHEEPIGKGDYERGHHFHCLIELESILDIRNQRYLDIEEVHGNYQAVKDLFATLNYVKKYGDYIAEGFPGLRNTVRNVLMASTEEDAKMQLLTGNLPRLNAREVLALRNQLTTQKVKRTVIEEITTKAPFFAFQKALEPYPKEAGFVKEGRPMGILMYGEPQSGKTTMAYRVALILMQKLVVYRDMKEMSDYEGEEIIMFDEMTGERFSEYADFFAMAVTEPEARTPAYYGSKKLAWPRKILIGTNEDVSKWKWNPASMSRFLMIKTYANNQFEIKRFKDNHLVNVEDQELRSLLNGLLSD